MEQSVGWVSRGPTFRPYPKGDIFRLTLRLATTAPIKDICRGAVRWTVRSFSYCFLSFFSLTSSKQSHPVLCSALFTSIMVRFVLGKYCRMFISWLRHIVKTATIRSYRSLLFVLLQLVRHFKSIVNGKEEDFREWPGNLALSSQPGTDQPDSKPAPVSLAVPLLEAPPQSSRNQGSRPQMVIQNLQTPTLGLHEGSNDAAFNTDFPLNSSASLMSSSVLKLNIPEDGIALPPPLAAQDQTFDITLIPIIPQQVNRYRRNVRVYANRFLRKMPF